MKKKIILVFVTVVLLLSVILTGCSSGSGIAQADYDNVKAQLADVQSKLTKAQADLAAALADNTAGDALKTAQATITDLQKQLADLKAQYEWAGLTPAQIAEKLIQNYHATHVYTKTDMFICGDMSSEVWNMLKAQGISAVIVIGNKDATISDILQSNHAWVLADVGGGQKLALETTAGIVIKQSDNPLYYRGWTFSSPADITANNDLIKEHNLRVSFRNLLAAEMNTAIGLYNNSTNQAEADKYLTLYDKLKALKDAEETIINQLKAQIDGLATTL